MIQLRPTETKFYVTSDGNYIGGFAGIQKLIGIYEDGSEVILHPGEWPAILLGGREVSSAPEDARQIWNFETNAWLPLQK